jgi:hypothetical protein
MNDKKNTSIFVLLAVSSTERISAHATLLKIKAHTLRIAKTMLFESTQQSQQLGWFCSPLNPASLNPPHPHRNEKWVPKPVLMRVLENSYYLPTSFFLFCFNTTLNKPLIIDKHRNSEPYTL